uniref:Uncharacterized protein n=1 Tax=Triticum urartu TaxID=4572 RepID=A0A8R7U4L2_TRIUA
MYRKQYTSSVPYPSLSLNFILPSETGLDSSGLTSSSALFPIHLFPTNLIKHMFQGQGNQCGVKHS